MDIKTLQYFIAIAECGNFSKAAKKLYMTQPPLSKQIQLLESELGVLLIERGSRECTLTDAGKRLYDYAQSIIDISNAAIQDMETFSHGNNGILRIGVASSASNLLLTIIEKSFAKQYPEIIYQLFEKNTFELINLLEKSVIEVALLRSPFPDNASFHSEIIKKESIIAVASENFFDDTTETFNVLDLDNNPVIIYRLWESTIKKALENLGVMPKYICINDDARTSMAWACSGLGIALLPSSSIYNIDHSSIICKPLNHCSFETEIALAWKTSNYISPVTKNFIRTIRTFKKTFNNNLTAL